ncbi:MAG: riboflavin biosynthesis protein RibF [Actinomycetia bacterium]|nr:riboflavin biosynthesis protein RibF [Actinomycetes bacterium]
MNVVRHIEELEPATRGIAIGTFDGVHRGHRAVIDAARAPGLRHTVLTFDPHPRMTLGKSVAMLGTLERRLELLAGLGVEDVVVLHFDEQLAELSAEDFAASVFRGAGAEVIAAGEDFVFGAGRKGNLDLLEGLGFAVRRVPLVDDCSSTRIRSLLADGEVVEAAALLGRPAEIEGMVELGDQRGGTLGFPTANLAVPPGLLVPRHGIYAGSALGHRAALSIGTNPHYGGTEQRIEAFLLDYDGDLYGKRLVVELWERLRDEAAFESEAALVAAIASDVERTRAASRPG